MASKLDSPFDLERSGPAVDLALEEINEKFLKGHKICLRKVQGRFVQLQLKILYRIALTHRNKHDVFY